MKRYFALCPGCGNERELSRAVVDSGHVPLCDGCGRGMDVFTRDPKPKRQPPLKPVPVEDLARGFC